jgi:putative serine protease PepD
MPMSDETKTIPTVGPGVANPETSHATPEPTPHADSPETPAAPPPPAPAPEAPGSQPSSPVAPFPQPATPPTPAAAAAKQPAPATPPASAAAAPGSSLPQPQSGTTAAVPGWPGREHGAAGPSAGGTATSGAYGGPQTSSPTTPAPPGAPAPGAPASAPPVPPQSPGHPQPPSQPPSASPVPPPPPGRGRRAVAVLTAAGLMLVSATGGALLALNLDDNSNTSTPVATSLSTPASSSSDSAPDEPLSEAAAAVLPSVVSISFDAGQVSGSGSGIIISDDGQILTNNHVVASVADGGDLKVTFSDGSTADADIVGRDPATDLAVIKAKDVSGLTPAKFGSSESLHVGDTVLAIGSPLGLDGSVSSGIVSALGRSVTLGAEEESPFGGGGSGNSQAVVIDAIQTDAAINPGNSGGALVNTSGEVVGINTAIASLAQGTSGQGGNIGVGFAIPIDSAKDIAQQLIDHGEVTHAFLGVRLTEPENGGGALIVGVEEGQPAAQAGLQAGDLITKVGDNDVRNAADLTAAIRTLKPGDKVTVSYTRDGEQKTAEVTLGELPTDNNS